MQTRERLLDVAGELLGEVGIERISTNMICARAGVTPPALYRYFKDKYAVLEALGRRLMDRQNVVLSAWLDRYVPKGLTASRITSKTCCAIRRTSLRPSRVQSGRCEHCAPCRNSRTCASSRIDW